MTKRRKKAKYTSEEEESTTEEEDDDDDEDENEAGSPRSTKPNDPVGQLCQRFPKVPRGDITRSKMSSRELGPKWTVLKAQVMAKVDYHMDQSGRSGVKSGRLQGFKVDDHFNYVHFNPPHETIHFVPRPSTLGWITLGLNS